MSHGTSMTFFFLIKIKFRHMSVLPVCHLSVCCPRRSEEYVRSNGLGVVNQNVGAGNRTWVFWKGSQCSSSNSGIISPVLWQCSWLMLLKHIRKSRLMKWRSAFFSCLPYCRLIKQKTVFLDSDGLGLNLCVWTLCSPDWSWIHDPSASVSWVLRIYVCIPGVLFNLFNPILLTRK